MGDLDVRIVTQWSECTTGLYSWFKSSESMFDCVWETYEPTLPLYSMKFLNDYDSKKDYRPWLCNNPMDEYPGGEGDDDVIIIEGDGVFNDNFDAFLRK